MSDFLTEVKSTRKVQANIEKFESLTLNENSNRPNRPKRNQSAIIDLELDLDAETTSNSNAEPVPTLTAASTRPIMKADTPATKSQQPAQPTPISKRDSAVFVQKKYSKDHSTAKLVEDAREILRHQPSLEDIDAVLAYFQCGIDGRHDFNIKCTNPKAAMLSTVLATHTIPDIWPRLNESELSETAIRTKRTLLEIMFSVTGIEALLGHIKVLSQISRMNSSVSTTLLDFMTVMLKGSKVVWRLLHDTTALYEKDVQRRLCWQSIVKLFAGSRILSTTALTTTNIDRHAILQNGSMYTKWLATNIIAAAIDLLPTDTLHWANLTELFRRGLSLGYKDVLVTHVYSSLLLGQHALWSPLHSLMHGLPSHDQKIVLDCILDDLSNTYLRRAEQNLSGPELSKTIAGAAGLINGLVSHNRYLVNCLVDWVSSTNSNQVSRGPAVRRAVVALLAGSNANLELILERTMTTFANRSHIQNAAIAQQQHLAQTILLVIGYLHRQQPSFLKQIPIPSLLMNATSNRLASSVPETRLLGMLVAIGMSQCVDEPGKTMDFGVEEMETEEVKALLTLTQTQDRIGDIEELKNIHQPVKQLPRAAKKRKIAMPRTSKVSERAQSSKVIAIEEISSSSEEDDLVPYQKPIDDPEDSDEDPTLINRDKPNPPVYIIDLIKQLEMPSDKLDIISLALKTAPSLIRRKAGFGTELSDNMHGLVAALINLQDGMSKPERQQQRLDALIACMVAQPKEVGKVLTNTYFNGDFSLSQRGSILTAIGLGAREVAGFADGKTLPSNQPDFPSQRLPPHLQPNPLQLSPGNTSRKELSPTSNLVSALTNMATADTIRPLAQAAVESTSGPSVLQITKTTRTSSRLSKTHQHSAATSNSSPTKSRTKHIPKDIHSILVHSIYLPLISPLSAILAYVSMHLSSSSPASSLLLHSSPLTLHIQTLTLTLHTLGPIGLSPSPTYYSVTHETVLLLTHLSRTKLALDGTVLPALLGLLLALIDLTVEIGVVAMERLVGAEFGAQVAELVRWTAALEDRSDAPAVVSGAVGDAEGGMPWTVLAAGIQVRWVEIGKRFQSRMLGLADDGF